MQPTQQPAKAPSFTRKLRSVLKRTLLGPVNSSGAYIMQVSPDHLYYNFESFNWLKSVWTDDGTDHNQGDLIRLVFFITNLKKLQEDKVPGAFAELGVWRGNSAKVLRHLAPDRKLYLLDTFEGFSTKDTATDPSHAHHSGFADTTLDRVKNFVGINDNTVYCPGYFPDTASMIPPSEKFAFVHLDCDLEAPIRAGLDYFYPRMNRGGMIFVHDYESGGAWPGVKKAVDEFLADKPESLVVMPDKSGTAIFRKV